jgi:hypothetical protein
MKLLIVPASRGVQWAKLGMRTFFRQPLALAGLFFMFIALMSALSLIPLIGNVLALALLPGITLGLMAASKEADSGKFPMPVMLFTAFLSGKQQARPMLVLGAMYAAGFLLVMGASALVDGGDVARLYLMGGTLTPEIVQEDGFQLAMLLALALYIPLSLLFWHAPALVYWHGVSPLKSLFFSFIACMRNFWAFTVFGMAWLGTFVAMGMVIALVAAVVGSPDLIGLTMFPAAVLMASMFFTSLYFTYQDCFDKTLGDTP